MNWTVFYSIWLFVIGSILGSYAVATVWRIRAREVNSKKKNDGLTQEDQRLKRTKLSHVKITTDYSRCLHCGHRLAWYDLVPVLSWLELRGKCRYCKQAIGATEILAEIGLGVVFALSYLCLRSSVHWTILGLWMLLLVVMTIMFVYDIKWQLLPLKTLYLGVGVAALIAIIQISTQVVFKHQNLAHLLLQRLLAVNVLGGLYYLLAKISQQTWVGSGDAYVGTMAGLVLGDVWLAFLTLFLANALGCLVVLVKAITGKIKLKGTTIALGPLLITALIVVFLFSPIILQYIKLF